MLASLCHLLGGDSMVLMKKETSARRLFSKRVDKRSRAEMTAYLSGHFRDNTMNSWNRSTSYACNMKLYKLGLDQETEDKLWDMIQVPEFYERLNERIEDFNWQHNYLWQAGWNGRSGGYLVLYQGGTKPSGYRSYCTKCGQKNYTSIAETGNWCGVCNEEARVDYIKPPMQIFSFPGRDVDMDEDFEDWSLYELQQRTELVQEFDRLADDIVAEALYIAQNHSVEERTVYMPTTELVLA